MNKKADKPHQNQKHDKNTPKGVNASFELQVKNYAMRGFREELQLAIRILDTGKQHCKAAVIPAVSMATDTVLKSTQKRSSENAL